MKDMGHLGARGLSTVLRGTANLQDRLQLDEGDPGLQILFTVLK
jgi:hypothetical protein